jgi:hypothetical protein
MKQFLLLYLAKHYGLSRENCDEKSRYLLLKRWIMAMITTVTTRKNLWRSLHFHMFTYK